MYQRALFYCTALSFNIDSNLLQPLQAGDSGERDQGPGSAPYGLAMRILQLLMFNASQSVCAAVAGLDLPASRFSCITTSRRVSRCMRHDQTPSRKRTAVANEAVAVRTSHSHECATDGCLGTVTQIRVNVIVGLRC